jgi:hypothetical protein
VTCPIVGSPRACEALGAAVVTRAGSARYGRNQLHARDALVSVWTYRLLKESK